MKFRKAYRATSFLCLIGILLSNQSIITGIVVDNEKQIPIHGANVYLEKLGIGTTSQVDGQFKIDQIPYGEVYVKITMIGFKDVKRSLLIEKNSHDLGMVSMAKDTITIKEIVVDAHHELKPEEFLSNIYVSGSKLQENLKSTLAMTLEQETGVSVQTMGQAVAKPVLRGYTGDRFLLTENGITTGDLSNTAIDHAISFDMTSFNNARIVRGPETLLYGSNTIGGVIDVSRQSNLDLRFKKVSFLSLVGAESSNNGAFANFTIYVPIKGAMLNADYELKPTVKHQFKFLSLIHISEPTRPY